MAGAKAGRHSQSLQGLTALFNVTVALVYCKALSIDTVNNACASLSLRKMRSSKCRKYTNRKEATTRVVHLTIHSTDTHTNTNLCLTWLFAHCVHTRLTCCFDIIISTFPRCSVSVTTEVTAAIHSVSLCDIMCCVLALDCHTYYSLTLQCPIAEWMACYCVLSSFCFDIVVVSTLNTSSYTHTHSLTPIHEIQWKHLFSEHLLQIDRSSLCSDGWQEDSRGAYSNSFIMYR